MPTVLLYGNSLIVSSIGASLQSCADLQVLPVDPAAPDIKQRLGKVQPDVIIFDVSATQNEGMLGLWKVHPNLLLIGVDLAQGQALVLSSQPADVLTTNDLLEVIQSHVGKNPKPATRSDPAGISK